MTEDIYNPPFQTTYKSILESHTPAVAPATPVEECELPVIDLGLLDDIGTRDRCKRDIVEASSDWGFFQVTNHGIPEALIERVRREQRSVFKQPFEKKANERLSDFSVDSYRWGVPSATSLQQLSWSEAYHIPLTPSIGPVEANSLRETVEEFASALTSLAHRLAAILSEQLGYVGKYFNENCKRNTCYLRLNRYPPCPAPAKVNGMIPHTDSDFLTILYQDQVGGLQVMKDGRWIAVKPNPDALIINIGDLFQAWSNGEYKSVEHRVASNPKIERFSVAYFFCPSYDAVIESFHCREQPPVYRRFSFREYRQRVQEDVKLRGYKVGLPNFLA